MSRKVYSLHPEKEALKWDKTFCDGRNFLTLAPAPFLNQLPVTPMTMKKKQDPTNKAML